MEQIGKIRMDDSHYPGEDLYSDGAVEDEILEIVKNHAPSEYGRIIEERGSWPVLYHLSPLRENIVDWIPLTKDMKVLEVGSGCGAITGALAKKAGSVTCIELSRKRSLINAYRHQECDNVEIRLGNFQDIEPELEQDYDYIFLIGVFEYGKSYIGGEKPFETFLEIMLRHKKRQGVLAIAIENRFGLKYWAGCREDHLGTYFAGLEGYPGEDSPQSARTFTRQALEKICRSAGAEEYAFYYPYPDYKFMTTLYSDERLPQVGELSDNMRNFDRDRLLLFDEKNVFDSLIREGLFPLYSNSYMLFVGGAPEMEYVKFSNDRTDEFAICTQIVRTPQGRQVRKRPMTEAAQAHIRNMQAAYEELKRVYEGSGLKVNRFRREEEEAVFEYLPGETLEQLLDECLDRQDEAGFRCLFERYCHLVRMQKDSHIYNLDFIFPNVIVGEDGWHLIDYEWTTENNGKNRAEFSVENIICRALYCYGLGAEKRKKLIYDIIKKEFNCEEEGLEKLAVWEKRFQKYVTGNRMSMVEIRNRIGQPIIPAPFLAHRYMEEKQKNRIQIYEDLGGGFSEKQSYFLENSFFERETVRVEISWKEGMKALRVDPAMDCCLLTVQKLLVNGESVPLTSKTILLNGKLISGSAVIFDTKDPSLTILLPERPVAPLALVLEFAAVRLSGSMAEQLMGPEKETKKKRGMTGRWLAK